MPASSQFGRLSFMAEMNRSHCFFAASTSRISVLLSEVFCAIEKNIARRAHIDKIALSLISGHECGIVRRIDIIAPRAAPASDVPSARQNVFVMPVFLNRGRDSLELHSGVEDFNPQPIQFADIFG